ncbi:MAG: hypothetical protein Q8R26_01020 [bacterium]|nr:hypothetical protein [bacterium]
MSVKPALEAAKLYDNALIAALIVLVNYMEGQHVVLSASAKAGSVFDGWPQ